MAESQPAGSSLRRPSSGSSTPPPRESQTPVAPKKRQLQQQPTSSLNEVLEVMKSRRVTRDQFDSFGEVVAHALRDMCKRRAGQIRAKIIALLFEDESD